MTSSRRGTLITATKIIPKRIGRAYFNVGLGVLMLAFLIRATVYNPPQGVQLGFLVIAYAVVAMFLGRSANGLLEMRREQA